MQIINVKEDKLLIKTICISELYRYLLEKSNFKNKYNFLYLKTFAEIKLR